MPDRPAPAGQPWRHPSGIAPGQRAGAAYVSGMTQVLGILLAITMLAVLGVLLAGMVGVAQGGSPERSNRLMRWRVLLQGVAIGLFALLMLSRR